MTDLHVTRWKMRYRLPVDARDDRARLDRALSSAIDQSLLDEALQRAGVPSSDEVCIRRVESFIRIDPSEPEWRLGVALSVAFADAIAARLRDGGPDVVRFSSRAHALADMACRAARGDLERAWAWRDLGIWRGDDFLPPARAQAEVVDALIRNAVAAPAVLRIVAEAGLLPTLLASVPADRWVALARGVLVAAGADLLIVKELDSFFASDARSTIVAAAVLGESLGLRQYAAIERIASQSAIMRAARRVERDLDPRVVRAIAFLAVLEREPDLAREVGVVAIAERVAAPVADRVENGKDAPTRGDATAQQPHAADERPRGDTAHGGLLFLLHVVRELDLPGVIAANQVFASRSLRWTLHQLALLLAPVAVDDAAALAFAGLAPGTRPPSSGEPDPTDEERVALGALVGAICDSLRLHGLEAEDDSELLSAVTSRRAVIVADPAWIEARFRIGDATTEIRRAGLDLDLGWLPWLGVVVRFVYA